MRFLTILAGLLLALAGPVPAGPVGALVSGKSKPASPSGSIGPSLDASVPLQLAVPPLSSVSAPAPKPAPAPMPGAIFPAAVAAFPVPIAMTPLKNVWDAGGILFRSKTLPEEIAVDEGLTFFDQGALHVGELPVLRPVDLNDEIQMSGLAPQQIDMMRRHSQGLISVYDFIPRAPRMREAGGYSLGIGDAYPADEMKEWEGGVVLGEGKNYIALSRMAGLTGYGEAYEALFGNGEARTEVFLDKITSQGKPIVFFLPRNVLDPPAGHVTMTEMSWFLDYPERMRQVTFVFGAYQTISREALRAAGLSPWSQSPLSLEQQVTNLVHVFQNFKKYAPDGLARFDPASPRSGDVPASVGVPKTIPGAKERLLDAAELGAFSLRFQVVSGILLLIAGVHASFPILAGALWALGAAEMIKHLGRLRSVIVAGWQASHDQKMRHDYSTGELRDIRGRKYGEDRHDVELPGPVSAREQAVIDVAAVLSGLPWVIGGGPKAVGVYLLSALAALSLRRVWQRGRPQPRTATPKDSAFERER